MMNLTVEELNSANLIRAKIEREENQLESLKAASTSFNVAMTEPKVQTQFQTSKVEKFALMILEAEQRIAELKQTLIDVSAELANKICAAFADKPLMTAVLIRHCCGGLSFSAIAQQLHFTVDYVRKIFKRATRSLSATKATA